MIMEMVIRKLQPRWKEQGKGFGIDDFYLSCICYADDIVLAAASVEHLEEMIADVVAELKQIGLGIGPEKTHWTSTPPMPDHQLRVMEARVQWEDNLTFVGTVIDLRGMSGPAIQYREAQANKAFHKWRSILTCGWIPKARRMMLLPKTVWAAFLWSASTWTPTQAQWTHIASWSARQAAKVLRLRRAPWQEIGQWWKFFHKMGHKEIAKYGVDLVVQCRLRIHSWAGHLARATPDNPAAQALRCRGMQWWRWRQAQHAATKDKWTGPHPQRFKIRRWEQQVSEIYGDGYSEEVGACTGWLAKAQDRTTWRKLASAFAGA